jgi:hypothetical protein
VFSHLSFSLDGDDEMRGKRSSEEGREREKETSKTKKSTRRITLEVEDIHLNLFSLGVVHYDEALKDNLRFTYRSITTRPFSFVPS